MLRFASNLAIAFLSFLGAGYSQGLTPTYVDVPYGSHPLEKLDVYIPPSASPGSPSPILIEIHPGGWAGGDKSVFVEYGNLVEKVYALGISIVSINHPVAPADLFPAANVSCLRAVQFVRANAAAWNLDPARIGVLGCSSGAHLAMWTAAAADAADPASPDRVAQQSSRVQACVAYEGPSDLSDQYYYYNGAIGHGVSPVWQFLGVKTQADWDALPGFVKLFLSPRWLVFNGGGTANADLRYLGVFSGNPAVESQSQLQAPTGDIHDLIHGLAFRDALRQVGAQETAVWHGWTAYAPGFGLFAADFAAEWLSLQLSGAKIFTIAGGTPGCVAQEHLTASGPAKIGTSSFRLRSHNGLPGSLGLMLVSKKLLPMPSDLLSLGFRFVLDPYAPELIVADLPFDAAGIGTLQAPIPNDAALVGKTYYAQAITVWFDSQGGFPYCQPSPFGLASSNALSIEIE